jgi:hypothetical protein
MWLRPSLCKSQSYNSFSSNTCRSMARLWRNDNCQCSADCRKRLIRIANCEVSMTKMMMMMMMMMMMIRDENQVPLNLRHNNLAPYPRGTQLPRINLCRSSDPVICSIWNLWQKNCYLFVQSCSWLSPFVTQHHSSIFLMFRILLTWNWYSVIKTTSSSWSSSSTTIRTAL